MRYNLFKKEPADTWELAKEKLIKSISLDESRIGKKYEKAFPYDYDSEIHFVYEGKLRPFKIFDDFSLYFYTDEEQALNGYRELKDGETITGEELNYIESPGEGYRWHNDTWLTNRQYGILTGSINLKTEKEKARSQREKEFSAYHKLISNFNAKVVDLPTSEMENIILWRAEWLNVTNAYTELDFPIEETYPALPERVKYYM